MKIIKVVIFLAIVSLYACGGDKKADNTSKTEASKPAVESIATQEKQADEKPKVEINAKADESSGDSGIGIGPIKSLTLGEIDKEMAKAGKKIFKTNCSSCHKFKKRFVGPPLKDVTKRRRPEWIMNMILNPDEMVQHDPVAKALLAEYLAPMAKQALSEEEVRNILEYFRYYDNK